LTTIQCCAFGLGEVCGYGLVPLVRVLDEPVLIDFEFLATKDSGCHACLLLRR